VVSKPNHSQTNSTVTPSDPLTHYCIVRTDIPVGVACANLVHAAGESSPGDLSSGTYAIALGAASEKDLKRIEARLEQHGVPFRSITESHGSYAGQPMAIGVEPGPKSERGRHLSDVPLLRLDSFVEYRKNQLRLLDRIERFRLQVAQKPTFWQSLKAIWRSWRTA
jgi:hypothetical protein